MTFDEKCDVAIGSIILAGLGIVLGLSIYTFYCNYKNPPATKVEILNTIIKYGCHRTGEFVGRYGDPVYICRDGGKYKYEELTSLAYKERK